MLTRNAVVGLNRGTGGTAHAMHPVLALVPWPELGFPVWPVFALLATWGAVTVYVAVRRKNRARAVLGGVLALAAGVAAVTTRGSRLTTGPVEVRAWGLFFAAALVLGSALAIWRGARHGLARELMGRVCVAAAVGGVIGARLGWALLHPTETESFTGALAFYRGGLSVWGGLGGALLGTWLSSRDRGASLAELCDLGATGFGAGVVLTRLGCFLEGCDFGVALGKGAPHFLATLGTFPKDSPAWALHVLTRDLSPGATSSLPVHPTWLYEAMGGGLLVVVAIALGRRKLRPGFTFGAVLLGYLLLRVSLDSLRIDPIEMWVSRALLGIVGLGAVVFVAVSRFRPARK